MSPAQRTHGLQPPADPTSTWTPLVSVVIPAYRQAAYLAETLQSVLSQTYGNLEAIVVDDASPDDTAAVVAGIDDPRVVYIAHDVNRGLPASRNTGMQAARGELIAWLDADDVYHPEKLEAHVAFLDAHPDVGFTYSARFEWNHSQCTVRDLFRPPVRVDLFDLVHGFPFCPSEVVVRRRWPFAVGLFDPARGSAEDTDLPCRMALAGCRFASVDRALNYRRYHSGRGRRNLAGRLADVTGALEAVFADPRCPEHVRAARDTALKVHLMDIVSLSLRQQESELAQDCVRRLVRMAPGMLAGEPPELLTYLLSESIADENLDHEPILDLMFAQLPAEADLSRHRSWAVARGHLLRGVRHVLWGRATEGARHCGRAASLGAAVDTTLIQMLTTQVLSYEQEFGEADADAAAVNLAAALSNVGGRPAGRRLRGSLAINRAFREYRARRHDAVPRHVAAAVRQTPSLLANRGVQSILVRSLVGRRPRQGDGDAEARGSA